MVKKDTGQRTMEVVLVAGGGVGIAAAAATLTFTLPPHQPTDLIKTNQQPQ